MKIDKLKIMFRQCWETGVFAEVFPENENYDFEKWWSRNNDLVNKIINDK